MKQFIPILLVLILGCKPAANPVAELASPSQVTRDEAAKVLRASAKPPWKIKWLALTSRIKIGETETNLLRLLNSYKLNTRPEGGMGGLSQYYTYRLDDYWLLGCEFNNNDYKRLVLEKWKLIPSWGAVGIWPPTNFSGVWITYYANGQKFNEGNFTNGIRFGEHTTYNSNASKNSVWHYDHGKPNGFWTQYFPSGQIQVQCQYSNGVRVGNMEWHYENGFKKTISHYDNGRLNGQLTTYFASGKIRSQLQYSNDVKIGFEVHYNEDGTTNSAKDLSNP